MSMKDNFLQTLMPIADNYSNPVSAAAGIIGLTNPGLGMALRYGPQVISILQGLYQAGGGSGLGARGASSGGMSGMVPSSLAANPSGVGGRGGLPLSDLSQYFQRGRALDDSDVRGNIPTMNQGGEVNMSIRQELMNRVNPPNPPGMRLLYPDRPPGPRNPYIPIQTAPPLDTTGRLGQIPPSSGLGPFSGGGSAPMPSFGGSLGFDLSQIDMDRLREMIRQRQQQMAQPAPQQPQIDPAEVRARLDAFLANNPNMGPMSLPFGGTIDIANLRDRMARLSTLMGRGMSFQDAMGNQRAAIAQGHDLNNDGIVTDEEYRQSTSRATGSGAISDRINALLGAVRGGGGP